MKKFTLTAFALLCGLGTANAAPIALPSNSPVFFQFNNIEQVSATGANNLVVPGYAAAAALGDGLQGNWGLFNISSIQNGFAIPVPDHEDIAGGPNFFSNDGPGGTAGQVTGIFYGVDFILSDATRQTATGGVIDLYWHDAGSDTIDASCMAGVGCLPDAAAVARFTTGGGGVLLARLFFASGIIGGNDTVFLKSTTDPTTTGGSGQADSYANVDLGTAGPWRDVLNGNWFFIDGSDGGTTRGDAGASEQRDIRFSTFFNATLTGWNSATAIGLRSNDPARVFTADVVPEPATLTLFGGGLLALVAVARRRKNA